MSHKQQQIEPQITKRIDKNTLGSKQESKKSTKKSLNRNISTKSINEKDYHRFETVNQVVEFLWLDQIIKKLLRKSSIKFYDQSLYNDLECYIYEKLLLNKKPQRIIEMANTKRIVNLRNYILSIINNSIQSSSEFYKLYIKFGKDSTTFSSLGKYISF